jgi:uncharacterized protein involved in exopolysaccharide biosynthesis
LATIVLARRQLIVVTSLALTLVVVAFTLLQRRTYTSTASFVPETGESQVGQLAALAAQFGFQLPLSDAAESPEFYVRLLRSREILRGTVETPYGASAEVVSEEDPTGTLIDIWEVKGDTYGERLEEATEELLERMETGAARQTGIVEFSIEEHSALLARDIADRMLTLVNDFDLRSRQSQAAEQRRFVGERLGAVSAQLTVAEDSLEDFLKQNRRYERSPDLTFEYERLQRRVTLQQQVVTSLAQAYEQAKIDEVKNTPVITVVETPVVPARPDRRRLLGKTLGGLIVGGILGVILSFSLTFFSYLPTEEPLDYEEFARVRDEAATEFRAAWKSVRRWFSRDS